MDEGCSNDREQGRGEYRHLPLQGVRVVEFCNVAAGPFCGMLLGDMGASVVKVESRSGDSLRQWPPLTNGFSENFASLNRNKQSIALDLKNPENRAVARRLIERADVVIENNRPGVMDRLGLGYASFADTHPRLIYCSMSAYGQSGPRSQGGGFDVTIQAMSGIMSVTGEPGRPAVKAGVPVSDFATGLYGAFAVSSLLSRVRTGGRGGFIDISMLGASLAVSALQVSEYFGSGRDPKPLGSAHPRNAPYQAFSARDGDFVLAAGNEKLWRQVCEILGCMELYADERFHRMADRVKNQQRLAEHLTEIFARWSIDDLIQAFEQAGIPCSRINSYSEALADPQVAHMGWVNDIELPGGVKARTFGSPLTIDGIGLPIRRMPPALDADRGAILAEIGQAMSADRPDRA